MSLSRTEKTLESKCLSIFDCKISYFDNEVNSNITFLCIHGNSSSKNSFVSLAEKFTNDSFRVVAIDLFGHGESEAAQNHELYSLKGYTNLIKEFTETLELNNVVLLGHSLGGHIAIESIPLIPERVSAIVTWGTPPLSSVADLGEAFTSHPALSVLFSKDVSSVDSENFIKSGLLNSFDNNDEIKLMISDFDNTDPSARVCLGASFQTTSIRNEIEILEQLSIPSMIIHGTKDQYINENYFRDRLQRKNICINLRNFSHYPHIDMNKELHRLISDFTFSFKNQILSNANESNYELS